MLLLLALLWGGSFFFSRVAVQHVPPLTLALARFSLAAMALHIFIAGRYGIYGHLRARWREFLILGLINNAIPHTFIFIGQTEIGAGLASAINATSVIWTVIFAHFLTTDERLTPRKAAGTLLGIAGIALLFYPHFGASFGAPLWALLLPLGAAISYGLAAIFARRLRVVPASVTATGQLTASTVMMLPLAFWHDRIWTLPIPPLGPLLSVLALALLSTAFAYILFFRIIAAAGATNASLVTLLVPPSAILLGTLFLGEVLSPAEWAGLLLIVFGLLVIDGRIIGRFRIGAAAPGA